MTLEHGIVRELVTKVPHVCTDNRVIKGLYMSDDWTSSRDVDEWLCWAAVRHWTWFSRQVMYDGTRSSYRLRYTQYKELELNVPVTSESHRAAG